MSAITRRFLAAAVLSAAAAVIVSPAGAQDYPTRPINWVVPFGPGSSTDLMARVLAEKISPILGQRVLIDNRVGGGGLVGAEYAARANPDGYTLAFGANNTHAVAPSLFKELKYDPIKSFTPISMLVSQPQVVLVNASSPIRSIPDLVAYAKANPGKLNFASTGVGTGAHLAPEVLKNMTGIDIVHVPYSGGAKALTDLLSNEVQLMFYPYMPAKGFIDAGNLRVIATTGHQRSPWAAEAPTMIELGYKDFAFPSWYAAYGPAGMRPDVVAKLDRAFGQVLKDPEVVKVLFEQGTVSLYAGPEELAKFTASEIARYRTVLEVAKVPKVD